MIDIQKIFTFGSKTQFFIESENFHSKKKKHPLLQLPENANPKEIIDTTLNKEKIIEPIDSTPVVEVKPKPSVEYTTQKAQENKAMVDAVHEKNNAPAQTKLPVKKPVKDNSKNKVKSTVYFTVQIAASTDAAKDLPKYMHIEDVHSIKGADGFVRFIVGNFSSIEDARKRLIKLKADGYKDAFLTAYNGDQRITVTEAVELLK